MADRVRNALEVLIAFFDARSVACQSETQETIEREKILNGRFRDFLAAMDSHQFDLTMDAVGLMPAYTGWHGYAGAVADSFKFAMVSTNGTRTFGLSNNGPVPRFVAEVIPLITGETPSVESVGKHLQRHSRKRGLN